MQAANRFRIATLHQNTLFSLSQMNQDDRSVGNRFFDVGDVVDARFRVKQMSAGDMGLTPLQRQQAS